MRQFKRYNIEAFNLNLYNILQSQPHESHPNILWDDWKEKFLLVADMHAPLVIRTVRSEHVPYLPWLTSEIKAKMYHRDFVKKKAVKTGSIHFHNAYKKARNNLSKLVKDIKANYYNNAINQCNKNPKSM